MTGAIPLTKPVFGPEEEAAIVEVLRSGWVTQGPKVKELERSVASLVGAKHAVATSSCTTALALSLVALGIGPGDEVLVPSFSFIATANAVVHAGAVPRFVDIDLATLNVDPKDAENALTPRTRAIMPVHQVGLPADLDPLLDLARRHDLVLIEDAACALGARYKGQLIGTHGVVAAFSFHPRKVITMGEGGVITTDREELAERLLQLRAHGMTVSDLARHQAGSQVVEEYPEVGYNARLTDLQAAVGLVQLGRLPELLARRAALARRYAHYLGDLDGLSLPADPPYANRAYQTYLVRLVGRPPGARDQLMDVLGAQGIASRRGVMAIHETRAHSQFHNRPLPRTEQAAREVIALPLFPDLKEEEQDRVIEAIRTWVLDS